MLTSITDCAVISDVNVHSVLQHDICNQQDKDPEVNVYVDLNFSLFAVIVMQSVVPSTGQISMSLWVHCMWTSITATLQSLVM